MGILFHGLPIKYGNLLYRALTRFHFHCGNLLYTRISLDLNEVRGIALGLGGGGGVGDGEEECLLAI